MKKLALLLLAFCLVAPMFADDAKVMPERVIRTYLVTAYQFTTGYYDDSGDFESAGWGDEENAVRALALGAAVEYGVTDWLTAAVQWAPGYTVWSATDDAADNDDNLNGMFGAFVGAKGQLLGPAGILEQRDDMRLAMALGIITPALSPDWETQGENAADGDEFTNPDSYLAAATPNFGLGFRGYYDYIFTEEVYLNLYTQFIYYLPATYDVSGFYDNVTAGMDTYDIELDPGYKWTIEVEPHYDMSLAENVNLNFGLPFTVVLKPENDTTTTAQGVATGGAKIVTVATNEASYVLTAAPSVTLGLFNLPLPLEFKIGYSVPLMGESAQASPCDLQSDQKPTPSSSISLN